MAGATSSVTTRLATNRLGNAAVPGASTRGEHQQATYMSVYRWLLQYE